MSVVLFYAGCAEVIAKNNTYKNSADFHPSSINALFITKSSGTKEEHLIYKHVCNNVFCMDQTWLDSFPTLPNISHYLFNFGINPTGVISYGSFVEFSNNYVSLGTLMSNFRNVYQEFICQNNIIMANNITAQPVSPSLFHLFTISSGASTGTSTIFNITNNHIVLRDYDPDLDIRIIAVASDETGVEFHERTVIAGLVNIKDNTINVNTYRTNTKSFIPYSLIVANEVVIQGNTIKAPLTSVIESSGGVGELIHTNNRYVSPDGINEIPLEKDRYVRCHKRRIEDNIFNGFSLVRYDISTSLGDNYQSTLNSFGIKGHTLNYEIHSPELKTPISIKGVFDYTNRTYTANSESQITVSKLVINEEYDSTNPESVPLISTEVTENETTEIVYEAANSTYTNYRYNLGDSYKAFYAISGTSNLIANSIEELGKDIRLVHTMNPF